MLLNYQSYHYNNVICLPFVAVRVEAAARAEGIEQVPQRQVKITEVDSTKYIHVRQNGTAVRVFRETSV